MSDIRKTLYEPNGGPITNKDACNIMIKKRYSGVVYCPSMDERSPGAMYPRAILLEHNGEENGTILATFEQYTFHKQYLLFLKVTMVACTGKCVQR